MCKVYIMNVACLGVVYRAYVDIHKHSFIPSSYTHIYWPLLPTPISYPLLIPLYTPCSTWPKGDLTHEEEQFLRHQIALKMDETKNLQRASEESTRKLHELEEFFMKLKQITGTI